MADLARLIERLALRLARRDVDGVTNAVGGAEDLEERAALQPGFRMLEERMRELMLLQQLNHWRVALAAMPEGDLRALATELGL